MNWDDVVGCWWIILIGFQFICEYVFQYYVGIRVGEIFCLVDVYSCKIFDLDNDKYIFFFIYFDVKEYFKGVVGIVFVFKI